ncbi:MAG: hypothetical protein IPK04_19260 [Bdellovibrionales bacterium]|nr:hypothetical protein [Bdellovibrionales bacterium]
MLDRSIMDETRLVSKLMALVHLVAILMLQIFVYQQAHAQTPTAQGVSTKGSSSPKLIWSYDGNGAYAKGSPTKIYQFTNKNGMEYQWVDVSLSSNKGPDNGLEPEKSGEQKLKIYYPVASGPYNARWGLEWRELADRMSVARQKKAKEAMEARQKAILQEHEAQKNAVLQHEEAQKNAILSKTKLDVLKDSVVRFGPEQVKFALAQGAVVYFQSYLNAEGDPRAMAEFYETVKDPMAAVGFYFFMLANGFTSDALQKYGVKNLDVKNRTRLFDSIKYIGMSAGLMASSIFHEASDTFKACALAPFKTMLESLSKSERSAGKMPKRCVTNLGGFGTRKISQNDMFLCYLEWPLAPLFKLDLPGLYSRVKLSL